MRISQSLTSQCIQAGGSRLDWWRDCREFWPLLCRASLLKPVVFFHSYTPVTKENVEVKEGDATEVNFSLQPTVMPPAPNTTQLTAAPAPVTAITPTPVQPEAPNPTSVHQPIQPVDFRHHHFSDMEIFLRRYANEYPNITRLYSVGKSVELRELYVMEISDNPGVHEAGDVGNPF